LASLEQRYPDNAPGDFYVDRTCIDCDACRRIAPAVFAEAADHSYVERQPDSESERRRALMALVACPTGSIGTESRQDGRPALAAVPEPVAENVSFCGFTSKDSFGAWSYFIERPGENVLVDSPKAVNRLLQHFEERGGIATMFLTHRDDVADHEAFARRFGCERVLHERDVTGGTRGVERKISGAEPVSLDEDLVVIPTPGHTRGHAVLLYRDKFLFTGDHLAWSARRNGLIAFRDACWYSWEEQIRSMERLLDFSFEWVLPGHGAWHHAASGAAMRRELERCILWMKRVERR
jgi:glyoxylase-like metal-dependent hydrolase (beta-lactamase superfamily II)/ferredoxin